MARGRAPRGRRNFGIVLALYLVVTALALPSSAQAKTLDSCLVQHEPIYTPGTDGVKPPTVRVEHTPVDKPVKFDFPVVLDLTISTLGNLCEIHVLQARDQESAKQIANYVAQNFRFSPATRKGKPVAVRFKVVFNSRGGAP